MHTLTLDQLRSANSAGGVAGVRLKAEGPAFVVEVRTRTGEDHLLVKTRTKEPRVFATLGKAVEVLHGIGIVLATVETSAWKPRAAVRGRRPDRSEALRRTHAAAAHDAWFRGEVEQGLKELESPGAPLIPHDEVAGRWQAKRAALLKRVAE